MLGNVTHPHKKCNNLLDADIFHLLAADAVINEVAGQDEAWQDHIRERDLPEDDSDGTFHPGDKPWTQAGIRDGFAAVAA